MNTYADTSFFVSLYLPEQHSKSAELLLASRAVICITPLHIAELTHAIEQHVFWKKVSDEEAHRVHTRFANDYNSGSWIRASIPETAYDRCADFARRHAARIGLRTLDTLHVALAVELGMKVFWTFDERQMRLAHAVGLATN